MPSSYPSPPPPPPPPPPRRPHPRPGWDVAGAHQVALIFAELHGDSCCLPGIDDLMLSVHTLCIIGVKL